MKYKIVYDARHWARGGIGEVIKIHLFALSSCWRRQSVLVLVEQHDLKAAIENWPELNFRVSPKLFSIGEQFFFSWLISRGAMFISPYLTFPLLSPERSVVWVHDLIWLRFPRYASSVAALGYFFTMQMLAHAWVERRVYISSFTRNEARKFFGASGGGVVYNPVRRLDVDAAFQGLAPKAPGAHRTILYMGTWKQWKRVPLLIEAFRMIEIRRPAFARLVLVGGVRTNNDDDIPKLIAPELASGAIRNLGYIDQDAWSAELASCDVVVVPSKMEGFGLPLLEAIGAGKRVVAARASVAEELVGSLAIYFENDDANDLATAIVKALDAPARSATELAECRACCDRFSIERHSDTFISIVEQLIGAGQECIY